MTAEFTKNDVNGSYWIQTCFMCKTEFKIPQTGWGSRRFCSLECRKKWQKEKSFWD